MSFTKEIWLKWGKDHTEDNSVLCPWKWKTFALVVLDPGNPADVSVLLQLLLQMSTCFTEWFRRTAASTPSRARWSTEWPRKTKTHISPARPVSLSQEPSGRRSPAPSTSAFTVSGASRWLSTILCVLEFFICLSQRFRVTFAVCVCYQGRERNKSNCQLMVKNLMNFFACNPPFLHGWLMT